MKTCNVLIVFVVILIVYAILVPVTTAYYRTNVVERFVEEPLPLVAYNQLSKRNLYFLPPHTSVNANERAFIEKDLILDEESNCKNMTFPTNVNNEAQSIIAEQDIIYRLASLCMSLKGNGKTQSDFIPVVFQDANDWRKFAYLKLLDPLFVELNRDRSLESTVALYIKEKKGFTICSEGLNDFANVSISHGSKQVFKDAKLMYQQIDGDLFRYPTTSTKGTKDIMSKFNFGKKPSDFHVRAYFLKPHISSQSMGVKIIYDTKKSNTPSALYSRQYQMTKSPASTIPDSDNNKPMKLLSKMIENYYYSIDRTSGKDILPTFTIKFNMNLQIKESDIEADKKHVALEMCMDNSFGLVRTCPNATLSYSAGSFSGNGNIITMTYSVSDGDKQSKDPSTKRLRISLGTSRNGCLFGDNDFVDVSLPYYIDHNINAVGLFTISPMSIDFFLYWSPPAAWQAVNLTSKLQWVFSQKPLEKGNDFYKLFNSKTDTPNMTLGSIVINSNPSVVPQVQYAQLGRINFAKELYDAVTR